MIHTDGEPTIVSSGVPDERLASVFGLIPPVIVKDAIQRDTEVEDTTHEHFRHMSYGAWRVCESLRKHMLTGEIETIEDMLMTVRGLSCMYEALYRGAA